MINWELFKNNMLLYFNENLNGATSISPASKIASEYELAISAGVTLRFVSTPIDGYFQTGFQKTALEVSLKKAFESSKNVAAVELAANIFSGGVSSGLLSAWATTQFSQIPIPVGFSVVATNSVVNTGLPQIILFSNKSTKEDFLNNLIEFFKAHLLSISGSAIGTAVNGTTPLTLPWNGIQ